MTTPRKLRRALVSHVIGIVGLLALVLAVIGSLAGPGEAASPSLSVSPSTNLTDGQQLTVTGTSLGVTGLVAVVECGNADGNGTPLPGNAPTAADCYGAESIGTGTILVPVANDSATTPYTVHTSGIGANGRKCISGGNFDCVIAMADVATQGNVLRIAASISFGGGGATTTTSASTTTTATISSTSTTTTQPLQAGPKLAVDPATNLVDGQSVMVTGTNVGASNFVAVVECGNADASGNALPGNAPTAADCYGAESVGTGTILVTANVNGTASTPYIVHDHGIGGSNRECIKNGNFECLIVMADVATQGNTLRISEPITFASSPPITTVAAAPSASSSASSGPTPASTTTSRKGTLPFTGLPPSIWLTIGVALCLLDIGYLLWSATRPRRRRNTA